MDSPLVSCESCRRAWHSATMAEGLRVVGNCPRCGGTLVFAAPAPDQATTERLPGADDATAPHLVLGVPRR